MVGFFILIGFGLVFGIPIYQFLLHKNLYYVITNKRVIIQKGVVGTDFEYIDFDQITNAEVSVGFFDKMFGGDTGSILIFSPSSFETTSKRGIKHKPKVLAHIFNPYEVFKFFKKISYDVKTDIEYPNQLRPNQNPGYQTTYHPDKA